MCVKYIFVSSSMKVLGSMIGYIRVVQNIRHLKGINTFVIKSDSLLITIIFFTSVAIGELVKLFKRRIKKILGVLFLHSKNESMYEFYRNMNTP